MSELEDPPRFCVRSLALVEELTKLTESPQSVPAYDPMPVLPFVKASFGTSFGIKVITFTAKPWEIPFDAEKFLGEGYISILDVKCAGHNVIKATQYHLCLEPEKAEGVWYLPHLDEKVILKQTSDVCCRKITLGFAPQFYGFLRIYEKDNVFHLVGLEAMWDGKFKMFYHVEVQPKSKDFCMTFLDYECKIIIWAKDKSKMAKIDKATGKKIHEIIHLKFETDVVYRVVSAILKCHYPSAYKEFIHQHILSDSSFIVTHENQESIIGDMNTAAPPNENLATIKVFCVV